MQIAVIVVAGVLFLGMGIAALVAPRKAMQQFGIELNQAAARSEVRAVYGGFGIAIAVVLGYAAANPGDVRAGIVVTVGAALAGMAAGRVISAVIDERTSFFPNWLYAIVEATGAALLFVVV